MTEIVYDIKKTYAELDSWIAGLTEGTYNVEVDCSGVNGDQFKGKSSDPYEASPFGKKLQAAKSGVYFNLKPININPEITDCSYMFYNCWKLTTIDTSAFTQVNNASFMFYGCSGFTTIDTSAFTQVINASSMFENCWKLTTITGTSAFTQVNNASGMFDSCSGLTTIDTSAFKQVNNAGHMFCDCSKLKAVDTSAFKQVNDASSMFEDCWELTSIDTSAFTQVNNAGHMFCNCSELTTIDTSAFKQVTYAESMFYKCTGLTTITGTSAFTQVTNAENMFCNCTGLTEIDTSAFTQVTNATQMFKDCRGLTEIDASSFTQVTNASYMFYGCSGLAEIDTSAFKQVNDASFMFAWCTGLITIDCSGFKQVNNASRMFMHCLGLTEIDASAFTQVNNANGIFLGCKGLTSIDTSVFTQVNNAGHMFCNCSELTTIDTSAFKQVTYAESMFSGCPGLTTIDTSAFIQVNNAESMFSGCPGLTEIDTSAFKKVTDASEMFRYCSGLTEIIWGDIKPAKNTNMFNGASVQKIGVADQETVNWIKTNESNMKLTSYTTYVNTYTKKYSELDAFIPTLEAGTYNLTVDCTGVAADQFKGSRTSGAAPFGEKLKKAKSGVKFNLKPINIAPEITDCSYMFYGCSKLTEIDTSDFTQVNNAISMFQGCSGLTKIDTSAFTQVTNASYMFYDCSGLTKVDISNFTSVTDTSNCFKKCNNLAEIIWGNIRPATNTDMFNGASKQKTIKVNSFEDYKFIKSNKEQMKLINYTVVPDEKIVPPDQMEFEDFDFYKSFYEQGNHPLKFTDDVSLDPSNFIGTGSNASPLIKAIKVSNVTFDFELELPKGLTNLNYTFNNATHLNSLKINWGDNKPENHTGTFNGCTAQKTIIVGPFDTETKNWIESNKSVMNLNNNYTIEGGSDTVKYSNLDTLASLPEGTYTFKIDTAGVLADKFKGTSATSSDFNSKLKANENIYYNIELDIPASDISYMLHNNKSVKSIKINSFNPVVKARTATAITADNAFNGCIFKEIDLNAFNNVSSANNMLDNNNNLEIIYDNSGDCLSKLTVNNPKLKTVYTTAAGREQARNEKFPDVKFYEKYERLSYAKNYGINPDDNHILGNLTVDGTINGATIVSDKLKESDSNGNSIYINGEIGQTMTFSVFDENDIKLPKLEESRKWKLIKEETYYEEI